MFGMGSMDCNFQVCSVGWLGCDSQLGRKRPVAHGPGGNGPNQRPNNHSGSLQDSHDTPHKLLLIPFAQLTKSSLEKRRLLPRYPVTDDGNHNQNDSRQGVSQSMEATPHMGNDG
jgi:hypothetical protein